MAVTYTLNSEVRLESGFENNDVSDANIESVRSRAFSEINSTLAARYKLPLSDNTCWETSTAKSLMQNIEIMLASGYLLIQEYGIESINTDKDGYKKRDIAKKQLQEILAGDLKLVCLNGAELEKNGVNTKDSISINGNPPSETRDFSTSDIF